MAHISSRITNPLDTIESLPRLVIFTLPDSGFETLADHVWLNMAPSSALSAASSTGYRQRHGVGVSGILGVPLSLSVLVLGTRLLQSNGSSAPVPNFAMSMTGKPREIANTTPFS